MRFFCPLAGAAALRRISARLVLCSVVPNHLCRDRSVGFPRSPVRNPSARRNSAMPKADKKTDKIDLNSMTIVQLKEIKGLGKSRAEEIVRYRAKNGSFTSVDDLDRVPHVGDMPPEELKSLKARCVVRLAADQAPPTAPEPAKVDVNHANIEELRSVEGIGADRA